MRQKEARDDPATPVKLEVMLWPEAERDVEDAATWYQLQRDELGYAAQLVSFAKVDAKSVRRLINGPAKAG